MMHLTPFMLWTDLDRDALRLGNTTSYPVPPLKPSFIANRLPKISVTTKGFLRKKTRREIREKGASK